MLDTAHLNEVNIIDHKILREMNCYSFIFGTKPRFLLHWTIPESTDVCFRVVLGGGGGGVLLGSGGGRCWKKPIWIDHVRNEWNSGTFSGHL